MPLHLAAPSLPLSQDSPRTLLESLMKTSSLASEQKRLQWGPLRGIFDPPLLHVLHHPGAGVPVSPWAPGTAENLSRQTSAAPQPCASTDLPQPCSSPRPSRSRGWFLLRFAGWWAHFARGCQPVLLWAGSVSASGAAPSASQHPTLLAWKPGHGSCSFPRCRGSRWFRTRALWYQLPQALAGRGRG